MPLSDEAQHNLLFIIAFLIFILFATGTESGSAAGQPPSVILAP